MPKWTTKNIPSLTGKVAVVTGSSSGLGYEIAYSLAGSGADTVLATRNEEKALIAIDQIKADYPDAHVSLILLDLTSLQSIADFVQEFGEKFDKLDILVNNAGVMAIPERKLTEDGFELQFGTNHLGHYALTACLLRYLASAMGISRVVTVSSRMARCGKINFDDVMSEQSYKPWSAYSESKLANLLFTFELQRHSDSCGWGLIAIAAHPGYARTNLIKNGPGQGSSTYRASTCASTCCCCCIGQSAANGALPVLYAAVAQDAIPGGYYGPRGCFEIQGGVGRAKIPARALDQDVAIRLWDLSAKLTKISWPTDGFNMIGSGDEEDVGTEGK